MIHALVTMLAFAGPSLAQVAERYSEYDVKAAMLYNFAKFVQFPQERAGESDELQLCILGVDPFGVSMNSVEGKIAQGRRVTVRRLESSEELGRCHIVFVSSSERENLGGILALASGLTVSEIERFAKRGGMVGLVNQRNRVRIQVNLEAAESAGLRISSKLLQVANIVTSERRYE